MTKRTIYNLALSVIVAAAAGTFTVFAEGSDTEAPPVKDGGNQPVLYPTIEEGQTGTLTLRYFDDNEETIPVAGAEFEVYQIADIGRDITTGENGAYLYLDETLILDNSMTDLDPYDYTDLVLKAYEKNPELGFKGSITIGQNGTATFTEMPAGAYLIRETKPIRYHIQSQPFVASVPETNDEGISWNFNVVVNPKQVIAGDLTLEKVLSGGGGDKNDVFTFKITITEGTYTCLLPDGSKRQVKSGDEFKLKGGQKVTILDVPAGTPYEVVELEANANGYKTTYKNEKGSIPEKTEAKAVVTNHKSPDTHTGSGINKFLPLEIGCGALTLLMALLYWKKRNAEEAGERN